MARRGSRRPEERDNTIIARSPALPFPAPIFPAPTWLSPLPEPDIVFDDRQFHPERDYRPQRNISGRRARLHIPPAHRVGRTLSHRVTFDDPKIMMCVRRKTRREVLHALRRTHKGSGSARRRTWRSDYSC